MELLISLSYVCLLFVGTLRTKDCYFKFSSKLDLFLRPRVGVSTGLQLCLAKASY